MQAMGCSSPCWHWQKSGLHWPSGNSPSSTQSWWGQPEDGGEPVLVGAGASVGVSVASVGAMAVVVVSGWPEQNTGPLLQSSISRQGALCRSQVSSM